MYEPGGCPTVRAISQLVSLGSPRSPLRNRATASLVGHADLPAWRRPVRLASAVKEMANRQVGMPPGHAGPGVAHGGPDLVASGGSIAVDVALRTDRLLRPKGTVLQPKQGVLKERGTFEARLAASTFLDVMVSAVHLNHEGDRPLLAVEATLGPPHSVA